MNNKKINKDIELSIIVPMYNEDSGLDIFFREVERVLGNEKLSYEIICINDGSDDSTLTDLLTHRNRNPAIKIINLSRNFGKEAALSAGLNHCRGRAVIPIDADLQDPVDVIPKLVAKWKEGYDVVYATRASREKDNFFKRKTSLWFYNIYNSISARPIPANTGDFRLIDARIVNIIKQLPERNRFMKGLFNWVGFKQTGIEYTRQERVAGASKWNYWKLWNFALDGITSFSTVPLRICTYLGLLVSATAFIYMLFLIIRTMIHGIDVPGYASVMVVVLMIGGIQLTFLGVIGEYLGRVFQETKQRPLYIVSDLYGLNNDESNTSNG